MDVGKRTQIVSSQCTLCNWASSESGDNLDVHYERVLNDTSDIPSFHTYFQRMPSSKRTRWVHALLFRAMLSEERKQQLLSIPSPIAVEVVEEIEELLDAAKDCETCTGREKSVYLLRRLLLGLCRRTNILPSGLFIDGVYCDDREMVDAGACADIFLGSFRGQNVALKRMRMFPSSITTPDKDKSDKFLRETLVWKCMIHENVQSFLGVDSQTFSPHLCMVSPWQHQGSIMTCLHRLEQDMALPILIDVWIKQVAKGLEYLHENRIIHGDLHCVRPISTHGDFGLAMFQDASSATHGSTTHGAIRFCSPELLKDGSKPSFASDIYAFGCLCLQLHSRQKPFPEFHNDYGVIGQLLTGARPKRPNHTSHTKEGFWDFVERCWDPNPDSRPDAPTLISSLPLEEPVLDAKTLELLPHTTRADPTRSIPASTIGYPLSSGPHFIDPCIAGLIFIDRADAQSHLRSISRLHDLGCSEDAASLIWDEWSRAASQSCTSARSQNHDDLLSTTTSISLLEQQDSVPWYSQLRPTDIEFLLRLSMRAVAKRRYDQASQLFRQLVCICRARDRLYPKHFHPVLAESLHNLGHSLHQLGRYVESIECMEEAIELRNNLELGQPGMFKASLSLSFHNVAADFHALGDHRGATKHLKQAVLLRQVVALDGSGHSKSLFIESVSCLCYSLHISGENDEATKYAREALRHRHCLRQDQMDGTGRLLASSLIGLARHHRSQNNLGTAMELLEETISLCRNFSKISPEIFTEHLAGALHDFNSILFRLGRYQEAASAIEEAIKLRRDLERGRPEDFRAPLAQSYHDLAVTLQALGDTENAIRYFEHAIGLWQGLARDHPEHFAPLFATSLSRLAFSLLQARRYDEALTAEGKAIDLFRCMEQSKPGTFRLPLSKSLFGFGHSLRVVGRLEDALKAFTEARELCLYIAREKDEEITPFLSTIFHDTSDILYQLGRHEEAIPLGLEAIERRRPLHIARPLVFSAPFAQSLHNLAAHLRALGKHGAAVKFLRQAAELRRRLAQDNPNCYGDGLLNTLRLLCDSLHLSGNTEEAKQVEKELLVEQEVRTRTVIAQVLAAANAHEHPARTCSPHRLMKGSNL